MAQGDDHSKWKITKELTEDDVKRSYLHLDKNAVETHILSHWDKNKIIRVNTDSTRIWVRDVDDAMATHSLHFRIYKDKGPTLEGDWRHNFVVRIPLGAGDLIGIRYEKADSSELCFKVLKRGGSSNPIPEVEANTRSGN